MKIKVAVRKFVAIVLASTMLITSQQSQVANAGTNGQQLYVRVCAKDRLAPAYNNRVIIKGKNQSGNDSTYDSGFRTPLNNNCNFSAGGWWWVGDVSIEWQYTFPGSTVASKKTIVNVPGFWLWSNWWDVSL